MRLTCNVEQSKDREVEIYLEKDGDRVKVKARFLGEEYHPCGVLAIFHHDGTMSKATSISKDFGFKLDEDDRIKEYV